MSQGSESRPRGLLVAALICFGIAAISFSGLILRTDHVGRALFGVAWGTLGAIWFGKYLMLGRVGRDADRESEER